MRDFTEYDKVYALLDYCYRICEEDALGALLGMMDRELFEGNMPADAAKYGDFMAVYKGKGTRETAIDFLAWHMKEFDFPLSQSISILEKMEDGEVRAILEKI
ncbi:MAG: hypothetical protein IJW21_08900 [Clostridia bacterium]|nr:hypothetical protein [Clostridia bacterium]